MSGYVNIKTLTHETLAGTVEGKEVSVAFTLYSDVNQIADAQYKIFPSDTPAYTTVFEENQREAWVTFNKSLFAVTPAGGE